MLQVEIITLFPEYFESPFKTSILGRAITQGKVDVQLHQLRDYTHDKFGRVDSRSLGGGPGMVMMAQPLDSVLKILKKSHSKIIYLSPQGQRLNAQMSRELANLDHIILICGHYEGIDQRVIETHVDQEISIGDYILSNGCLAALVVLDAVIRFIPGVLGDEQSNQQDSFEKPLLDHPHYTLPRNFEEKEVPHQLLTGHHLHIDQWRSSQAYQVTWKRRADLVANWKNLSQEIADLSSKFSTRLNLENIVFATNHLEWYRKILGKHLGLPWINKNATMSALLLDHKEILLWQMPASFSDKEISTQLSLNYHFKNWIQMKKRIEHLQNQEYNPQLTLTDSGLSIEDPNGWRIFIYDEGIEKVQI
jgi:tRNA (guanine37-N1)-methyltransferase